MLRVNREEVSPAGTTEHRSTSLKPHVREYLLDSGQGRATGHSDGSPREKQAGGGDMKVAQWIKRRQGVSRGAARVHSGERDGARGVGAKSPGDNSSLLQIG